MNETLVDWYLENYQTLRGVIVVFLFTIVVGWTITLRWFWDEWNWFYRAVVLSTILVWGVLLANTWDARNNDLPPSFRVALFFVAVLIHMIAGALFQFMAMRNQDIYRK